MKLKSSSLSVATATLLLGSSALAREPSRIAPRDAPSSADVAPAGESGERLEVGGVVYAADGHTPIVGASVYVYQTDARGYYRPDDPMGNRDPRLRALLRTDGQGRYTYRTIRPGSYPGTQVPRHIHYEVAADGHGSRIFEIVFDDDPLVTAKIRSEAAQPGSVYALQPVKRGPGGVGQVTQDVVLPGLPGS
jgi:protocatechuate 3,4-dioxygenase beta subunit